MAGKTHPMIEGVYELQFSQRIIACGYPNAAATVFAKTLPAAAVSNLPDEIDKVQKLI